MSLHEDSRHLTSFNSGSCLYEFSRVPFGLSTASQLFQRTIDMILKDFNWSTLCVYIDDILIFGGTTFEEHMNCVQEVLNRLKDANLMLNSKKSEFFLTSVTILGHVVDKNGMSTSTKRVDAIKNFPIPDSITSLRKYLGLCQYYRKFIRNFSSIAKPLYNLLQKDQPFVVGEEQRRAFQALKDCLCSAPVLAYPKFDKKNPFILYTDASKIGVGAILQQKVDNVERPIAYASRVLTGAEKRYRCVSELELLAVFYGIQSFHSYLKHYPFILVVDHTSLKQILKGKCDKISSRMQRWLHLLSGYEYEVEYRAGKHHNNVDALSRVVHNKEPDRDILDEDLPMDPFLSHVTTNVDVNLANSDCITLQVVKQEQKSDRKIMNMIEYLKEGKLPESAVEARK